MDNEELLNRLEELPLATQYELLDILSASQAFPSNAEELGMEPTKYLKILIGTSSRTVNNTSDQSHMAYGKVFEKVMCADISEVPTMLNGMAPVVDDIIRDLQSGGARGYVSEANLISTLELLASLRIKSGV